VSQSPFSVECPPPHSPPSLLVVMISSLDRPPLFSPSSLPLIPFFFFPWNVISLCDYFLFAFSLSLSSGDPPCGSILRASCWIDPFLSPLHCFFFFFGVLAVPLFLILPCFSTLVPMFPPEFFLPLNSKKCRLSPSVRSSVVPGACRFSFLTLAVPHPRFIVPSFGPWPDFYFPLGRGCFPPLLSEGRSLLMDLFFPSRFVPRREKVP